LDDLFQEAWSVGSLNGGLPGERRLSYQYKRKF
jgi:hypothetical protein